MIDQKDELTKSSRPVDILVAEHKIILRNLEELGRIVGQVKTAGSLGEIKGRIGRLKEISKLLLETESHHQREEQSLFPRLEKAGVTGPPRVMRLEHEELRARKHMLAELLREVEEMDFKKWTAGVIEAGDYIAEALAAHIGKEDNVLYPMAVRVFQPEEWVKVQQEFDRIGYCPFTPGNVRR